MTATIHCVRHAQGLHNVGAGCYTIPDPQLTPLGIEQCETLRKSTFSDQSNIALVMASPLCRTLHSAHIIFHPALKSGERCLPCILALPDAQETSDDLCDIGSDPHDLRTIVVEKNWPVDLSLITDGWNDKSLGSRYSPASRAIEARARDARILIRQKVRELVADGNNDVHIVLVTHGGFLHYVTNDWEDAMLSNGTGWQNCETRSYHFQHDFQTDMDRDAMLVETTQSRKSRGKEYPMFGPEVQKELFRQGMEGWGAQGLQRPDRMGEPCEGKLNGLHMSPG